MTRNLLIESTGDLFIIATTPALLDAEDRGPGALAALLAVSTPKDWPPEFNDSNSRAWMRRLLTNHPGEAGYGAWYIVVERRLVGICGYKGPPNAAGAVEIGYSVVAPEQRRGYATRAVGLLLARAFRDPRVTAVAAETLPSLIASRRVLERCGFALASRRTDEKLGEILRYVRQRE
jgi:[ribosomal protein S5]-alanine N-acetyltransferase